jgi:hypothetical protein
MKRFLTVLLVLGMALIPSCGGSDQPEPAEESGSPDSLDNGVANEQTPAAPVVFYPEGTLDPSLISVDVPVSAVALNETFFAWNGKSVNLQGYPYVFYGDSITVTGELELVADSGSREVLATVSFPEPLNLALAAGEPVTVSGTIVYSWTGDIELVDGEILFDTPMADPGVRFSPFVCDSLSALGVAEFYEQFNVLIGKEVTVEGYYCSITTSTLADGVVVRVDLSDPAETNTKYVGCEMAAEIPEDISNLMGSNRAGTQIRGTIAGESFDMVGLENCVLVNR